MYNWLVPNTEQTYFGCEAELLLLAAQGVEKKALFLMSWNSNKSKQTNNTANKQTNKNEYEKEY